MFFATLEYEKQQSKIIFTVKKGLTAMYSQAFLYSGLSNR